VKTLRLVCVGLLFPAIFFGSPLVRADFLYTYTGTTFNPLNISGDEYTPSSFVSGSFSVGNALGSSSTLTCGTHISIDCSNVLNSWSFSDSVNHLTSQSSSPDTMYSFSVSTDGLGNISHWDIEAQGKDTFVTLDCAGLHTQCSVSTENDPQDSGSYEGLVNPDDPTSPHFTYMGTTAPRPNSVDPPAQPGVWACEMTGTDTVAAVKKTSSSCETPSVDEPRTLPLLFAAALAAGALARRSRRNWGMRLS